MLELIIGLNNKQIKGRCKMKKLQGSEKQIKWAESIREKLIGEMKYLLNRNDKRYTESVYSLNDITDADVKNAIEIIENITEAKEIIDIRNIDYKEIISQNKVVEIEESIIEEVKQDEKVMKRISKIETKEDNETYIERTANIIQDKFDVSFESAMKLIHILKGGE